MAQIFDLGSELKDKVTGLQGIAIAQIEYLNGCVQYAIKPKVGADGKVADAEYVDSQQLELVGEGVTIQPGNTGGPSNIAPRV